MSISLEFLQEHAGPVPITIAAVCTGATTSGSLGVTEIKPYCSIADYNNTGTPLGLFRGGNSPVFNGVNMVVPPENTYPALSIKTLDRVLLQTCQTELHKGWITQNKSGKRLQSLIL